MKNSTFFLFTFFLPFFSQAQTEDLKWIFGGSGSDFLPEYATAIMDFSSGSRVVSYDTRVFGCATQNASLCDQEGDLWIYTNGSEVYNAENAIIENGEDFIDGHNNDGVGYSLPQNCLLLRYPETEDSVIFIGSQLAYSPPTQSDDAVIGNSPLQFSIIDMSANIGAGKVVLRAETLLTDTINFGKLTAVRHGNGRDWWVVALSKNLIKRYYFFLLDPSGIVLHHTQDIPKSKIGLGQANFSPDGNWYATAQWSGRIDTNQDTNYVDLYRFDRCAGYFSAYQTKNFGGFAAPCGVAFSPNSKLMYISRWKEMFQYDLEAADILGSELLVAEDNGVVDTTGVPMRFYLMATAPDGKIYASISNYNVPFLHVIEKPDIRGSGCQVLQAGVPLPVYNTWVMPNLPNPRLGPLVGSPCDTLGLVSSNQDLENQVKKALSLSPNPARQYFRAQIQVQDYSELSALRLEVFDALGRLVFEEAVPPYAAMREVDCGAWPVGLYSVVLRGSGRVLAVERVLVW